MSNYHKEQERKNLERLREIRKELPPFIGEFFTAKADYMSSYTRLAYAYDLRLFFKFIIEEIREIDARNMDEFTIKHFEQITAEHIAEFMEYLGYYESDRAAKGENLKVENSVTSKSRKLSTIRSVFAHFIKRKKISSNPAELVDTPPIKEKVKVYLEINEIADLIDAVEEGKSLTKQQERFHAYTSSRDVAILSLLAGTGIRVSEAVGININDIDLERGAFKVTRKGGNEETLYFSQDVEVAMRKYIEQRMLITPLAGHESALFLSLQKRRITTRAVQLLVKKYSSLANSLKPITPHKLRTSFGTNMYRETGDIYQVADLLGHKDVNTTRKNYADTKGDAGRRAVRNYRIRSED